MMVSTTIDKAVTVEPAAIKSWSEGRTIFIELTDGRIIGFPADRFKILKNATDEQLKEVPLHIEETHGLDHIIGNSHR